MAFIDRFKLMRSPELRRFHYQPLYYDPKKDSQHMHSRKLAAQWHKQRDPILHGKTMLEKMEGNNPDPYIAFSQKYKQGQNKILLYLFFSIIIASIVYAIW
jgi:hypothetical protein